MSVFVGTKYENKSLTNLAKLVDDCEEYGVPVMAVTSVGRELEKTGSSIFGVGCPCFSRNRCTRG